ncbi:MAG: hypothetical protein AMXMBFR78_02950 [Rubrivivax sp.]|jgi:SAM-dependent methyltransferase
MIHPDRSLDSDYRSSHLAKGAHYDASLAGAPFDHYMSEWERHHVPRIVRACFPSGVERYLDFACGTGRVTQLIAPLARESMGVDISPTMIEEARKKCPATHFHLGDLTREDPDLGQFDLISSFRFFGNAQPDLREAVLTALVKRMKPDGALLINSHRNPNALYARLDRLTGGDAGEMDLTLARLRALLDRHGLRIAISQPIGTWMYRSRLLATVRPDDPRALRNEGRFSRPWLTAISPDALIVARRR